jgi:hypothetical protein
MVFISLRHRREHKGSTVGWWLRTNTMDDTMPLICIKCEKARFPRAEEQCYKMGGLICTVDNVNVGKYDTCRFGDKPTEAPDND